LEKNLWKLELPCIFITMGQRIVISESEKSHIRNLYESSPPPSESVLLMKKNPYNLDKELYDKVMTGDYHEPIRRYNSKMVDGDIFVNVNEQCIQDYLYNRLSPLFKSLVGKTIRFDDDTINRFDDKTMEKITKFSYFNLKNKEYVQILIDLPLSDYRHRLAYVPGYNNLSRLNPWGDVRKDTGLSPGTEKTIVDFFSKNLDPLLLTKDLPDECFEIRKIQRRQTDF